MNSTLISLLAGVVIVAATPLVSHAQPATNIGAQAEDFGMREYVNSCAVCHGSWGKGDGPLAPMLTKSPPDLSTIQTRNNGVFPFNRVYGIIDGREEIAAHGPREMPVWGTRYNDRYEGSLWEFVGPKKLNSFVRGRIVAVTGYVYSLQEK